MRHEADATPLPPSSYAPPPPPSSCTRDRHWRAAATRVVLVKLMRGMYAPRTHAASGRSAWRVRGGEGASNTRRYVARAVMLPHGSGRQHECGASTGTQAKWQCGGCQATKGLEGVSNGDAHGWTVPQNGAAAKREGASGARLTERLSRQKATQQRGCKYKREFVDEPKEIIYPNPTRLTSLFKHGGHGAMVRKTLRIRSPGAE